MRRPLNTNERRIVAVSVLVLIVWAFWYLVIDVWFLDPLEQLAEEAEVLQAQHQRYENLLSQWPALRKDLERARLDPVNQRSLLPGTDPSASAAELMQHAVDSVSALSKIGPGCEVSQRMPIVPEQSEAMPYRQVKVSLTLDCGVEPLTKLLQELEYGQPFLFVEALSVHRSSIASTTGGPGRLKVQMLLRGYLSSASTARSTPAVARP